MKQLRRPIAYIRYKQLINDLGSGYIWEWLRPVPSLSQNNSEEQQGWSGTDDVILKFVFECRSLSFKRVTGLKFFAM